MALVVQVKNIFISTPHRVCLIRLFTILIAKPCNIVEFKAMHVYNHNTECKVHCCRLY